MLEGPVGTGTGAGAPRNGGVAVRTTSDRRAWSALATRAFADTVDDVELLRRTLVTEAAAAHVLTIASLDGTDAGASAMSTDGDLAVLFGAAVLPAFRGKGVHAAMVAGRLAVAHARGATRAAVKTRPDSPVERTAAHFGFERTGLRRRVRRDSA
jgi:GNAT superfamily N-acetyltransferase